MSDPATPAPGTVPVGAFEGARALVTGGAQGIGAAAARLLAAQGASVVVGDLDAEHGEAVAEEVGGRFVRLDVADPAAWDTVPDVDVAFLNAGLMTSLTPVTVADLTAAGWERVRRVNADGAVLGVTRLLPAMTAAGRGSILLAGSLAGLTDFPADPFYTATKAATISLARCVGTLCRGTGVRVNSLCPGEVETRMLPPDRAELLASKGYRPLRVDEVAEAAVEVLAGDGTGEDTGQVWVLVAGRRKQRWEFPPVPRPLRDPEFSPNG